MSSGPAVAGKKLGPLFGHTGKVFEFRGVDGAVVARNADGGALFAWDDVWLETEAFDALADAGNLGGAGVGLHDDQQLGVPLAFQGSRTDEVFAKLGNSLIQNG